MSSEFDFEISSSESEIDDFEFEDKKEISKLCVLLNVHGTVKAIVDAIDCLQKNKIESTLYILENGSYPAYRKYIEDNILKQTYSCVAVKYHFEEKGINVDEMFQKGMDLVANDNINRVIFSHNYELSKNIDKIMNQNPIQFQKKFNQNVLFKIENKTNIENTKINTVQTQRNKSSNKNFVQRLKERKRQRNTDSKTFQQNKDDFVNMFEEDENTEKIFVMLPTYNRGTKCIKVINEIRSQNISNWFLYVVDDGSDVSHSNQIRNHVNRLNDPRIEFDINIENMRVPKTLNKGIRKFIENNDCNYFTWISDDNDYYSNFLSNLYNLQAYFAHSAWGNSNCGIVDIEYKSFHQVLHEWNGLASFMWSKEAVKRIGFYNEEVSGVEDYDYLLRTYIHVKSYDIKYSHSNGMKYYVDLPNSDSVLNFNSGKKNRTTVDKFYKFFEHNIKNKYLHPVLYYTTHLFKNLPSDILNKLYLIKQPLIIVSYDLKLFTDKNIIIIPDKYKVFIKNYKTFKICRNIFNKDPYISIVMSYYNNRKKQTLKTLDGFENKYNNKYNFEVVIVDDNSNNECKLDKHINKYNFPINLIVINEEEKGKRINPCIAYNKGFTNAIGDIIIIQNPECYHIDDIIGYTLNNLTEQDYYTYSCYQINTPDIQQRLFYKSDICNDIKLRNEINVFLRHTYTCTGKNENLQNSDLEWLNHIEYPKYYHYCSAIYKNKLDLIGGFDNRFKDGYCFDDDELVLSIKLKLKLNISVIDPKYCFVVHQYHTKPKININEKSILAKQWKQNKKVYECLKLNYEIENGKSCSLNYISKILIDNKIFKKIFLEKYKFYNIINEIDKHLFQNKSYNNYTKIFNPDNISYINNIPKILFTYWDMSNLSFMHFLTLYTVSKHHPDYQIVLYYPKKRVNINTWKSSENKIKLLCKDYLQYLSFFNIKIIEIDFEYHLPDIPYYLSEVIKSDFFRLYISKEVGGIWFDMDTFWLNSIDNNFFCNSKNYYEDIVKINNSYSETKFSLKDISYSDNIYDYSYFVMCSDNQDNFIRNSPHYCQYILFHNKNSKLVKLLYESCESHLNCNQYESIGTPMFSKVLSNYFLKDTQYNYNKTIFNINVFAPFKWYQMEELFEKTVNFNLEKSSCIHWFNGSSVTKKFINIINHYNFENIHNCSFKNILNKYLTYEDKITIKNMDLKTIQQTISIVMAYFNRKEQLILTLESIKKSLHKNLEIIIVDDNSRNDQKVELFIDKYKDNLDIKVITIKEKEKDWVNPCIAYNIGIKHATGDIIVLQNPEVMHVGDCLTFINNNLNENDWLSFNCYGSPSFSFNENIVKTTNIYEKIKNTQFNIGGNSVVRDDVGGWLNHYEKHFVAYHYLAAIYRKDLFEKMDGGFNEKFKDGIGADDDELIKRLLYNKFNFKIPKFDHNMPFCIHLYHEKSNSLKTYDYRVNKNLFFECCKEMNFVPENNIAVAPYNEIPMYRRILI